MRWFLKYILGRDKHPVRGLLAFEWAMMLYVALTLLWTLFMYTEMANPEQVIGGRFRVIVTTLALWAVYRLVPCRMTIMLRVALQMLMLIWWYPDTFELNRHLPNLDHHFARLEQALFGYQPALTFAQQHSNAVVSELLHMGYASYYPLIALVTLYYFFLRYEEFLKAVFIILASFFIYYVIFILLPVTGPQFYYLAVGTDQIAQGLFPPMGDYFNTHQESLPIPGWSDGLFYHLVADAHDAGERPTAAFPSSHIGITTILLLLAWKARSPRLMLTLLPFFLLMCLATVYIQAHYAVDVLGGVISAFLIYVVLQFLYDRIRQNTL